MLLDVTMPRMGGEEAFRRIRALRSDAKIVISSGYEERETVDTFGEQLTGFIKKPFRPMQLIETMTRITRAR